MPWPTLGRWLGPSTWTALAGVLLWGTGAALGFPVTLSAGADEPVRAAGRVGVITSIGYCGFVGGPPRIGFLAGHTTLARALLVVAVVMAASVPSPAPPAPPRWFPAHRRGPPLPPRRSPDP
ncbi:hypothetical protein ACU639_00705 [Streptomyces cynarae]|uniref:hypothetical protein n=1 Tax=Streptomyces cynarae TaxID=2981134 RepID=UPI00406C1563